MSAPAPTPRDLRGSLMKAAAQFSIGSALGLAGNILRAGMAARLLPADVAGTWLGLQLVYNYGVNLHLGTVFGMFRNVPMLRGRGDDAGAETAKATTFTFLLGVVAVGCLALSAARLGMPPSPMRGYLFATGALTLSTLVKSYYVALFKAESRFREVSISSAVGSVVSFGTLGLIWIAGLDGLIWGMFAQSVTEVSYLARQVGLPAIGWDSKSFRSQLAVGLQTLAVGVATTMLTSIDRTVMLQRLGASATGLYYVGANVAVLLPALAALPFTVLTPRFFERAGRGESMLSLVEGPVRAGSMLFAVLLGCGALGLPPAVAALWPSLAPGNDASLFALVGAYPLVLSGMPSNVFYALNRQMVQLALLGLSAVVGYGAALAAAYVHPTLLAVAAGSTAGLFAYYVGSVFAAYKLMGEPVAKAARLVLASIIPAVAVAALVGLIGAILSPFLPASSFLRACIGVAALATLALVPVRRQLAMLRKV